MVDLYHVIIQHYCKILTIFMTLTAPLETFQLLEGVICFSLFWLYLHSKKSQNLSQKSHHLITKLSDKDCSDFLHMYAMTSALSYPLPNLFPKRITQIYKYTNQYTHWSIRSNSYNKKHKPLNCLSRQNMHYRKWMCCIVVIPVFSSNFIPQISNIAGHWNVHSTKAF